VKKLEIGPSSRQRTPDGESTETWDTLDSSYKATFNAKWSSDITSLPIPAATYDWVHASHVLEHLPWWQTIGALTAVHNILKFGGRFTVWVPDALKIVKLAMEDSAQLQELEKTWRCGGLNPDKDPWIYMNARVFWGARPGEVGQEQHFHRAMFGEESLKRLMEKAGFTSVARIKRNTAVDVGHGWMEIGMEGFK
jgi:ubiquinone/menaquinone biosynthesis C-methylase UbiE